MPQHRLAAAGVELGDPVPLDVRLAAEAELLLHRDLDRQAVAVPAGLAGHVVALHGPVAREDVLEHPGLDVVHAGRAVRGRRALVEHPGRVAGALLQAALEDLVGAASARAPRAPASAGRRGPAAARGALSLPFLHRRPMEGRAVAGPRYHPPWVPVRTPRSCRARRVYSAPGAFLPGLRGDLHAGQAPGLPPPPGRCWLRPALLVPIDAFSTSSVAALATGIRAGRPRLGSWSDVGAGVEGRGDSRRPAGDRRPRRRRGRAARGGRGPGVQPARPAEHADLPRHRRRHRRGRARAPVRQRRPRPDPRPGRARRDPHRGRPDHPVDRRPPGRPARRRAVHARGRGQRRGHRRCSRRAAGHQLADRRAARRDRLLHRRGRGVLHAPRCSGCRPG